MKSKFILLVLGAWLAINYNVKSQYTITDTIFDRSANESFAYGADISWGGTGLKDKNGVPKDLLTILKEQGLNSVRYRVWYPDGGASGKNQVVNQAKEAHAKGFKVMIDFHYSDSWADPGKQFIPSAWEGHTTEQLIQDVYDHTYDVLKALKDEGVTPAWVQIGNETKRGMLWPNGNTETTSGMQAFAKMVNSGYDAIKAVDSSIQAIVHLPDADENSLYRSMFDKLKSNGARWDIIGMSAYPHWAHLDWETEIDMAVANMKDMIARYDTKVMVVEAGHYWYEPYIANNFMVELMDTMMTFGGLGCFWWEPQSTFGYNLTAWDPATKQPTIAMDAYLGIKYINPASFIETTISEPADNAIYDLNETINMAASATHANGEISKMAFYVDEKKVGEDTSEPFTYELANPGTGIYSIYAVAIDTNGTEALSETVTVQVGAVAIFQENEDGYCGITNNAGTIDNNHENFTGTGFINGENVTGSTVNWTINFKETGKYSLQFRYAGTSNRPGTVKVNDKSIGTASFTSTGAWAEWGFSSLDYNVTETGEVPVTVTSTSGDGLPNIDYLSIISLDGNVVAEAAAECYEEEEEPPVSSIYSNDNLKKLKVYPVPANDKIIVASSLKMKSLKILAIDGSFVKAIDNVNAFQVEIPLSDLSSGLYLIQTTVGKETHVRKFNIYR